MATIHHGFSSSGLLFLPAPLPPGSYSPVATFGNGRRVAIVAGLRTPFAKAGTVLKSMSAIELGRVCVAELIERSNLDPAQIQSVVFGTVNPSVVAPNIAREVALMPLLPKGVQAYTVGRA